LSSEQYAEDCRNGLFDDWDDPYYGYDDYYDYDYDYDNHDDDDDYGELLVSPGDHVRSKGEIYLVLENYRWANLITGKVIGPHWRMMFASDEKVF